MPRPLRIIGTLIALGLIGALVVRHVPDMPRVDLWAPNLWLGLSLALAAYLASQATAVEAWRRLLLLSDQQITARRAWSQPLVSQIGKYVPGNVVHLLGRVALGRQDGIGAGVLTACMLVEVAVTLGVGLGVTALLILTYPQILAALTADFPGATSRLVPVTIGIALVLGLSAVAVLVRARLRGMGKGAPSLIALVQPVLLHLVNFTLLGLSLWAACFAVGAQSLPSLPVTIAIFAVAWSIGFVFPGAPGGIGVRDSIVVLGLALSMGEGAALAAAILHRGTSVVGDVVLFGLGWLLRRQPRPADPKNEPELASFASE